MAKKIRGKDESERATDEPRGGLEEVADAPDGSEDEKVEQRSDREGRFDEKKAASPGPSGA